MRWVQRDFFYLENLSFDGLGRDVLVVSPKLFSTLLLGRGWLPKRAASGSDAWSGSSVNIHPSKYYGLTV